MEYPISQSAWRRGWNDTKKIWTSWPFFVLDAVVAVVIGGVFEWYWGLVVIVFGMICVWFGATASAPVKQRNEARKKLVVSEDKFVQLGYIEGLMYMAINLQRKLNYCKSRGWGIDDYDVNDFKRWNKTVSDYLQENMPSEHPVWCKSVDISRPIKPELDTIAKAYDSGFEILRNIQKDLTS